jgi:hypothetical protein
MKIKTCIMLSLLIVAACTPEGDLFRNPSPDKTGIDFENTLVPNENANILDYLYFYNGGGVAIGDINDDGLPDIFFSGNQVKNKLYINQGDLKFKDISEKAGITGASSWNTGAVMGDVNGDGLLDIYVCAVVGINGFRGYNELYINNGDATFTESAEAYGIDFDSYSSSAAFLDYDQDGDLDIYLLNHAVHTQESFGKADLRYKRNYQTGDKLLRNDGERFTDVSEEAGIFGGINGYGLGVAVADFNQDGWPDVYVGNDFHEDDYYYLNNGDGTFSDKLREHFGQTTRFSMGNDVADINHDGWPDIISLDMLPEDEKVLKSSEGDDDFQSQKLRTRDYGYHYQFTRNMLHLNSPQGIYRETALISGVAATDWSWSALFADYNQDGEQDLFISNGIPKRPNDLDFINFVSSEQIKKTIHNTKLVDQKALDLMPSGKVHNYVFEGNGGFSFADRSGDWIIKDTLISGATAIGDLDGDGDLDVVTNNINNPASIYVNKTDGKANYLKLRFNYPAPNTYGIGTKAYAYHDGRLQYKELYTVRGFQASSEPMLHFGFGAVREIDSIRIVWPNNTSQTLTVVATNQTLELSPSNTRSYNYNILPESNALLFGKVPGNLGIDFIHSEDKYIDFNRQKLIPYQVSDRGPATAIGDLDNDGLKDLFFGGSKYAPAKIYIQKDSTYVEQVIKEIAADSINEDVTAAIADFNGDGREDLYVGTGGADFYGNMKPLLDSYYQNNDPAFAHLPLPEHYENTSAIRPSDFDADGDLDLFVSSNAVTADFGKIPNSYLLKNNGGNFVEEKNETLQKAGMVTDAIWDDFNSDGTADLIVVGEWMEPRFFTNRNGRLKEERLTDGELKGLWQCITPFDIDSDGDTDYILGNWGTNTKFKAGKDSPMKMYYGDFDDNGSTETIVVTEKNGEYYPLEGLPVLSGQLVSLRKKFTMYREFAGQPIENVLGEEALDKAQILEVSELRSGYLENTGGVFNFVPFGPEMQLAPIMALLRYDFDADGNDEVLAAGNYFGVKPYLGRFDSFSGALIKNKNEVVPGEVLGLDLTRKSARDLNIITLKNKSYLLVTFNNEKAQVYNLVNNNKAVK